MHIRVFIGTVLFALLASRAFAVEPRTAAPSAADEIKLRHGVQQQFSDLYTSDEVADQISMAKFFWKSAGEAETSDQEYALLCESRDAAARAGSLATAELISDSITKKFNVTTASARVGIFKAGSRVSQNPDAYFGLLFKTLDSALLADDFEPARQVLEAGTSTAASLETSKWQTALKIRQDRFDAQSKIYPGIKCALDAIRQSPVDPQNFVVAGEYTCLIKNDWHNGLAMLARGNDAPLRALATKELANPTDTEPQMEIADGWAAQAARLPQCAAAIQLHAYDLNIRMLPDATPVPQRTHVEEQLSTLIPLIGDQRETPNLWLAVGDALSHRAFTPSRIVGGTKATDTFQDLPRHGGMLVGFNFSLAMLSGQQIITFIQPIYNTPTGEQNGATYGKAYSSVQSLHAPDGYAVGALNVRGGAGLNSIIPTFMRIDRDHLNADEVRVGACIGGIGGELETVDGRGTPVIGICGRQKDGFIGLGLVFSQRVKDDQLEASTQSR